MKKSKVLFVFQEITPYLPDSRLANVGRHLPQGVQERGKEIRTFMPKFGCVNERRNQLHEVIRLSGMNIIIDDTDHPLIIKVASIQTARMQIYFIDNEEYFQRKYTLTDKANKYFKDNDERCIFYCRGVLETVKKLGWAPEVIHCHGWFSALVPYYVKVIQKDNPLFADTKIVYSIYDDEFDGSFNKDFDKKLWPKEIADANNELYKTPNYVNLTKAAIDYSDAVVKASEKLNPEIEDYIKELSIPVIPYLSSDEYIDVYCDLYDEISVGEGIYSE